MISDQDRELLRRAKELESERVEITATAIERRIADLLPEPWARLIEFDDATLPTVDISYTSSLYPQDVEVMTDRECREHLRFVAMLTDAQRQHEKQEHAGDDGG